MLYLQEFVYHAASYCNAAYLNAHVNSCMRPAYNSVHSCHDIFDTENWNLSEWR